MESDASRIHELDRSSISTRSRSSVPWVGAVSIRRISPARPISKPPRTRKVRERTWNIYRWENRLDFPRARARAVSRSRARPANALITPTTKVFPPNKLLATTTRNIFTRTGWSRYRARSITASDRSVGSFSERRGLDYIRTNVRSSCRSRYAIESFGALRREREKSHVFPTEPRRRARRDLEIDLRLSGRTRASRIFLRGAGPQSRPLTRWKYPPRQSYLVTVFRSFVFPIERGRKFENNRYQSANRYALSERLVEQNVTRRA